MQSSKLWLLPGLSYSRVSSGFAVRLAQEGEVFSGNSVFIYPSSREWIYPLLGLLNSTAASYLCTAHGRYRKTETIAIKDMPLGKAEIDQIAPTIAPLSLQAAHAVQEWEAEDECSPYFSSSGIRYPVDSASERSSATRDSVNTITSEISLHIAKLIGLDKGDLPISDIAHWNPCISANEASKRIVSWAVGCVFGRWDIRAPSRGTGELQLLDLINAQPNVCPAMLDCYLDGDYPIEVCVSGIVEQDGGDENMVNRVHHVLENDVERKCCQALNVRGLGEYLNKAGNSGFWTDHITRYTAFRRNAPIYWLLQSSKKNYALWLYYHRLDKDLLFKALVNYVEPKIRLETSRLETLTSQKAAAGDSGKEAKRLAKEVEKQEDFLSELRDFEDKLRRAANLHLEPDLNDGVVLNIAPLHELVPWKEAKNYWKELIEGEYEWSSIGKQLRQKGLVK